MVSNVWAFVLAVTSAVLGLLWIRSLVALRRFEARLKPIADLEDEQARVTEAEGSATP